MEGSDESNGQAGGLGAIHSESAAELVAAHIPRLPRLAGHSQYIVDFGKGYITRSRAMRNKRGEGFAGKGICRAKQRQEHIHFDLERGSQHPRLPGLARHLAMHHLVDGSGQLQPGGGNERGFPFA